MSKYRHHQKLNLYTAFSKRDKPFIRNYPCLTRFMGRHNATFLIILHDLHDYFDKMGMIENGVMFFSKEKFARDKNLSTYYQRQSLTEISALGILRVIRKSAVRQCTYIKFSTIGCFAWGLLISDIDEEYYPKLWRKIQASQDAQKVIRAEIKRLEREWSGAELDVSKTKLPKQMRSGYKRFVQMAKDIYQNEYFDE